MSTTYLTYQQYARDMSRSLKQIAAEPEVKRDKNYYEQNIGKVKSADDFLKDYRLYSYAMKAGGLQDMMNSKAFMRKVLTSDLSDGSSFVNKLSDTRFRAFAQNYAFSTKSEASNNAAVQNVNQQADTVSLYLSKVGSSSLNAISDATYYKEHIGSVKNVDDLVHDQTLLNVVMTAYGLDSKAVLNGTLASTTAAEQAFKAVIESDDSDPGSLANQMESGGASTADLPRYAQSGAKVDSLSNTYTKAYGRTTDLIHYEQTIGSIHSVDALLADDKLVAVATKAYGIDGASYSKSDLKKILTSDLDNPMSVANQLGPAARGFALAYNFTTSTGGATSYAAMAHDFNFGADGKITSRRQVQSNVNVAVVENLFTAQASASKATAKAATAENAFYSNAIASAKSLDDVVGNDHLVSYLAKAFGFNAKTLTPDTLRKVLTSDLGDPKSAASRLGTNARRLVAAFNFTAAGTVARNTSAQSAKSMAIQSDDYLRQTMETEAGQTNPGVKLALYFQRKAPTLTNAYSVLADPALLKVVQTALNIPAKSGGQDIDRQATQISNRLKFSDFQDPAKLSRFLSRFATLYDLQNASSSAS